MLTWIGLRQEADTSALLTSFGLGESIPNFASGFIAIVATHSLANAAVVLSAAMERHRELWDKLWVALTSLGGGAYLCPAEGRESGSPNVTQV